MQFRVIVVTERHTHTHTQTGPITIHCTTASVQCKIALTRFGDDCEVGRCSYECCVNNCTDTTYTDYTAQVW